MTLDSHNPQGEPTPASAARDFSHAWRALRHRNFQLFFGRPEYLAHRLLDDAHRDVLTCLPAHEMRPIYERVGIVPQRVSAEEATGS